MPHFHDSQIQVLEIPAAPELWIPHRKPIGPVQVDRNHWAGKHLVYGTIFQGGEPVDIVGGKVSVITGAPSLEDDALSFDGVSDKLNAYLDDQVLGTDSGWSMLIMYMPHDALVAVDYLYPLAMQNIQLTWDFDPNDGRENAISVQVGSTWYYADVNAVQNQWNHALITYGAAAGGDELNAYLDAKWQDGNNSMTGNTDTGGTNISIGEGGAEWNGKVKHLFFFNKRFENPEIESLSEDPYQFLIPERNYSRIFTPKIEYKPMLTASLHVDGLLPDSVAINIDGSAETEEINYVYKAPKDISKHFSISFWTRLNSDNNARTNIPDFLSFKDNADTTNGLIMYYWNSNDTYCLNAQQIYSAGNRERGQQDNSLVLDTWHHVVFTFGDESILDFEQIRSYVDGKEVAGYQHESDGVGTTITMGGTWTLFGQVGQLDNSIDAAMAGFGVYDRVLLTSERLLLSERAHPSSVPGCVFAPNFSQGGFCPISKQMPIITGTVTILEEPQIEFKPSVLQTYADVADLPAFAPVGDPTKNTIAIPNSRLVDGELMIPGRKPTERVVVDRDHWAGKHLRYGTIFQNGQVIDVVTGGDAVTTTGTPTMEGGAAMFDGSSYFRVAFEENMGKEWTELVLFKPTTAKDGGTRAPFNLWNSIICKWSPQAEILTYGYDSNWYSTLHNAVQDEWNHVAGVWDSKALKAYLNGVFESENTSVPDGTSVGSPNGPPSLHIARGSSNFTGGVKHIFLFDKGFNAAEIAELSEDPYQFLKPEQPAKIIRPELVTVPLDIAIPENDNFAKTFNADYLLQPVSDAPVPTTTFSCWFKAADTVGDKALISLGDIDTLDNLLRLYVGGQGDEFVYVRSRGPSPQGNITSVTTNSYTPGKWHHAVCLAESATSRYVYLDGIASVQSTTDRQPENIDNIGIGCLAWSDLGTDLMEGSLAEPTIWNVALTDAEIKRLAAGEDPNSIRPKDIYSFTSLRDSRYFDSIRNVEWDLTGSPTITENPSLRRSEDTDFQLQVEEDKLPGFILPEPRFEAPSMLIPGVKPTVPITIDWEDPLTEKLDFYLPMQGNVVSHQTGLDLVTLGDDTQTFEYIGAPGDERIFGHTKGLVYDLNDASFDSPHRPQYSNVSEFTMAGWFLQETIDAVGPLFNHRGTAGTDYWSIDLWSDGLLYWSNRLANDYTEAYIDYSTVITAGEWFHIGFVWNGNLANDDRPKLYINGKFVAWDVVDIDQHAVTGNNAADPFYIGYYESTSDFFNGFALCAMGWTRALNDKEVKQMYDNSFRFLIPK